jgi:hypothetical protein
MDTLENGIAGLLEEKEMRFDLDGSPAGITKARIPEIVNARITRSTTRDGEATKYISMFKI